MNIKFKSDDKTYLTISLSGECPKQEINKIPEIIFKAFKDTQNNKILLDTSLITERVINTLLQFEYSANLVKLLNGNGIILGIYGNNEIYTQFTETVAANRGATVKVSNDYETIKLWLTDKK